MNCSICGLPKGNLVGSVLPQCLCGWQNPNPPATKREWVGLTDEEVQLTVNQAVSANTLSWLGYRKDDDGKYTVPVLSPSDFQFARAIEAKLKEKNND
jgi:hypothetical protein